MDKNVILPKLGIRQALLQTSKEIFKNTKTSTIVYINSGVFFYHLYEFNHLQISVFRVKKYI